MTVGKEIGEFEMKSTAVTLEPGWGRFLTTHVNFEGSATGEIACEAIATMTFASEDGIEGDYKLCARCFMHDGQLVDATGDGKTVKSDDFTWSVAGITEIAGHRS